MKILVIGSTGQLGQDLLGVWGDSAVGCSHQSLDVTDGVRVMEIVQTERPEWVVNTAAFHRVDECEINPALAFAVNTLGAFNVARAAAAVGAGVVFYSTDYVFGGALADRREPYVEVDCPHPVNVYGVSKHAGEQLVTQATPRHCIIRSSGLYGTATSRKGWTFPELMLQRARVGERLRVVADQVLCPTYALDLAATTRMLVEREATGVFHVVNAGECSWFTFAQTVLTLGGVRTEIEPIDTVQAARRARRPGYSALQSVNLAKWGVAPLRPWKEALRDYLRAKEYT